ncbi:hypothetical protein [Inmirania thermothiophila]|uniref:Uncharacterized protein n=1 Tax=Inmirania thermothiophila TaxID=1750597 RepID=A0A3N1Y308_9GAMM|nr:hypothetical protein [Inmirania thermothiophila]ROR32921.1 hypothetical protein EDC57_2136 [Inmirania thermothiophila]
MGRGAWARGLLAAAVAAGAGRPAPAQAVPLAFLPPRLGGDVSYTLTETRTGGEATSARSLVGTVRARTRGVYRAPWFATLDAEVALSLIRASSDESENTGEAVTGRLGLDVFPQSRFPFRLVAERRDTRTEQDATATQDTVITRLEVQQQYATPDQRTRLSGLAWTQVTEEAVEGDEDVERVVELTWQRSLETQSLGATLSLDRTRRRNTGERDEDTLLQAHHLWRPAESRWSVTTQGNAGREETVTEEGGVAVLRFREVRQLTVAAIRQAVREQPLTLTLSGRVHDTELGTDGETLTTGGFALLGGARYQPEGPWTVTGFVSAVRNEDDGSTRDENSQSVDVDYSPAALELGPWRYSWNAGTGLGRRDPGFGDAVFEERLSLGHALRRAFATSRDSRLELSLTQRGSVLGRQGGGTDVRGQELDSTEWTLLHHAGLGWVQERAPLRRSVNLSLSDSRTITGGDEEEFFQQGNLQLAFGRGLAAGRGLSGSLTLQATRQRDEETGRVTTDTSSSGSVTYTDGRFLGVGGMRFSSTLSLASEELVPALPKEGEDNTLSWENRLDYRIGRLDTQARLTYSERSDAEGTWVFFFTVRRSFGAL